MCHLISLFGVSGKDSVTGVQLPSKPAEELVDTTQLYDIFEEGRELVLTNTLYAGMYTGMYTDRRENIVVFGK